MPTVEDDSSDTPNPYKDTDFVRVSARELEDIRRIIHESVQDPGENLYDYVCSLQDHASWMADQLKNVEHAPENEGQNP